MVPVFADSADLPEDASALALTKVETSGVFERRAKSGIAGPKGRRSLAQASAWVGVFFARSGLKDRENRV